MATRGYDGCNTFLSGTCVEWKGPDYEYFQDIEIYSEGVEHCKKVMGKSTLMGDNSDEALKVVIKMGIYKRENELLTGIIF